MLNIASRWLRILTTNTITMEDNNELDDIIDVNEDDGIDYKAQFEQERASREKAEADAQKREKRFKTTKANEWKTQTVDQDSIKKMVDDGLWLVQFYSNNKNAAEFQWDIEELVAKGIDREKAYKFVLADKDPTALLDDAKKAQLQGNTDLNWVPKDFTGVKDPYKMTDDEIADMSDADFDKAFPSTSVPKKFFAE